MKKFFHLILFALVTANFCSAQIITFDKTLPDFSATQVFQTEDGGYLLTHPDIVKFTKTDRFGYIEWTKECKDISTYSFGNLSHYLCKTLDGGYIAVGNNSSNQTCLVKLNNSLDTIWTKTYGLPSEAEIGQAVIQLPDSSFIISSNLWGSKYRLRKTDLNGSLIWAKEIIGTATLKPSFLVNLKDGNFLFGDRFALIKMNFNADTIWSKNIPVFFSDLTDDGHILFQTTYNGLKKLDLDGNLIWEKDIANVRSIAQSPNGNYILLQGAIPFYYSCMVKEIDTSGNIINDISYENGGAYLARTDDGGFVICGSVNQTINFLYTWLLKTDGNLNYKAVNLKKPLDGDKLSVFTTYSLIWKANNINFVNIDYSVDNQNSWNSIIKYYPASADTFFWTLPNMPAGNLFIKISDSFNSNIYDRSDPPQTAINYQAADYIAANEIFMWIGNNGMGSHDPRTDGSGFFWPGGENATIPAIFADGLVWGGKVNGEIRVNGSTYRYGLTPGYILSSGLPSDPLEIKSKIFKLKKDWQYLPPGAERDRYEFDFLNWPVDVGAPWEDKNGDGVYTLGIDEPKILGDETLFFVANDLDTLTSLYAYGSNPIGLEFQVTTFGFNNELLKDLVFKKYKVINKSPNTVTDMYLSYWADDDLGYPNDDYVGFDSSYYIGYVYNGDNDDNGFYGTPPPAVGHMIVQGPIIPTQVGDSARYGNGWKNGFRNLKMSSSGMIVKTSVIWPNDPDLGDYEGTIQFYNMMQGLQMDGSPIINPYTGEATVWPLSGDPVSGVGWYRLPDYPTGWDQRYHVPTGPFTLAPTDTQEIVVAIFMARGTNNLNSVSKLKEYAQLIQDWYNNDFVVDVEDVTQTIPLDFSLSQNYPNPFNPSTRISWQSPVGSWQTLRVYDVLGNEVATLVDGYKPAGDYEFTFNASKLSSGVYIYRLQSGGFIQTKKMMVLK